MKEMTEEEADYWNEYYTKNPPEIDPSTNRFRGKTVQNVCR